MKTTSFRSKTSTSRVSSITRTPPAPPLGASHLLLLTAVDAVYADWPEPAQRAIRRGSDRAFAEFEFEPGSMGPKVEAARSFARSGGTAGIGALADAARILQRRCRHPRRAR